MSIIDLREPADEQRRVELNLPPLVGNASDLAVALRNWAEGKKLCSRCRGTGNELFSMLKKCEACSGSGEEPRDELNLPPLVGREADHAN